MFISLIAFGVVVMLYGLIWHNLPSRKGKEP